MNKNKRITYITLIASFMPLGFTSNSANTEIHSSALISDVSKNKNNLSSDNKNSLQDVKVPIWENIEDTPVAPWGYTYRFALEGTEGTAIVTDSFNEDEWWRITNREFYIDVKGIISSSNIRITTGWWTVCWPTVEYNNVQDLIDNEDGTYTLKIDFRGYDIYDHLDSEHLLFTGVDYTIIQIYYMDSVSCTVDFNLMGHGKDISSIEVEEGSTIEKPNDPIEEGWLFGGWYKEEGCINPWDFATDTVTANTTLYAKWTIDPTTSIDMKYNPIKTHYLLGEEFNVKGAKIAVTHSSGAITYISVTDSMISGYDKDKCGEQLITVTYDGCITTFKITVTAPVPEPTPTDTKMSGGSIAGIILGSIAGAIALTLLIFLLLKNRKIYGGGSNKGTPMFSNITYKKAKSCDARFDEYKIEFIYKNRPIAYFFFTPKSEAVGLDKIKKEFNTLMKKANLKNMLIASISHIEGQHSYQF